MMKSITSFEYMHLQWEKLIRENERLKYEIRKLKEDQSESTKGVVIEHNFKTAR